MLHIHATPLCYTSMLHLYTPPRSSCKRLSYAQQRSDLNSSLCWTLVGHNLLWSGGRRRESELVVVVDLTNLHGICHGGACHKWPERAGERCPPKHPVGTFGIRALGRALPAAPNRGSPWYHRVGGGLGADYGRAQRCTKCISLAQGGEKFLDLCRRRHFAASRACDGCMKGV